MGLKEELLLAVQRNGQSRIHAVDANMSITYADFFKKCLGAQSLLLEQGIRKGEVVVVQTTEPLDTLIGVWGLILCDAIPTVLPVSPNMETHLASIDALGQKFKFDHLLCNESLRELFSSKTHYTAIPISWDTTAESTAAIDACGIDPSRSQEDLQEVALLQFSSGSTGNPKGVMLSHGNILANSRALEQGLGLTQDDRTFNWLPLSHDYGLVAFHITSLLCNLDTTIMSPSLLIKDPAIWTDIVRHFDINRVPLPNFAMEMILRSYDPEQYRNADLSGMRSIITAGEKISLDTCRAFANTFARHGLDPSALMGAYGLAEATVAVSIGQIHLDDAIKISNSNEIGKGIAEGDTAHPEMEICNCGTPLPCNEIRIFDDEGNILEDDYIGNIVVEGPNVSAGYYGDADSSASRFVDGNLLTGDIGFLHEGELYVTGRKSDIIIINGKNHYAGDIEKAIHDNIEELGEIPVAAFSIPKDKKEQLFIAIESESTPSDELVELIRQRVLSKMNLRVEQVVHVEEFPRTASGKIQYHKLSKQFEDIPTSSPKPKTADVRPIDTHTSRTAMIVSLIERELETELDEESLDKPFVELGLESIQAEEILARLEEAFDIPLTVEVLWNHPTINQLSDYIGNEQEPLNMFDRHHTHTFTDEPIAVVSMACHFPGDANTPGEFWDNLISMKDSICTADDMRIEITHDEGLKQFKGGYLSDVFAFDPKAFGLTPREAQKIDPQHRLLLRTTKELIDNSRYDEKTLAGSDTGVFIGISNPDYMLLDAGNPKNDIYDATGNALSIAANRISYLFGLNGPSIALDTACSSSLVSVHLGAQALRNHNCSLAICGGVNLILNSNATKAFFDAGMISEDAACKTFDQCANGYVRSEGAGLVMLKRLSDAQADGDTIYATIAATAVNQDGKSNGLTAPNGKAQEAVIASALARSGCTIDDIDYIEAHGTGTKLGDPIEVNSLANVFADRKAEHPCFIGSVKTNIGHLESAAGIASFIKAVLMLNKNAIPPVVHFSTLNPYISIDESKLRIASADAVHEHSQKLGAIGISSFGFGGTNCHAIVSKYEQGANIEKLNARCEATEIYYREVSRTQGKDNEEMPPEILDELKLQTRLLEKLISAQVPAENATSIFETAAPAHAAHAVHAAHTAQPSTSASKIEQTVIAAIAEVTAYPASSVRLDDVLQDDLGLDSIMTAELASRISDSVEIDQNEISGIIAVCSEPGATVGDLCKALGGQHSIDVATPEDGQTQDAFDADSSASPVEREECIGEFPEYLELQARQKSVGNNPYYKVNYGVPRDLILTDDGEKINYSTYNYVGLNGSKTIGQASIEAIKAYGTSVSGSRMISGEIKLHRELEERISSFLGTQDTIAYIGGYTTNVSAISTIVSKEDLILHDALSHNSIITGCILSGAKRMSFKHNDMDALERALKKVRDSYRRVLIVVEGVYSMDGDICNLPELIRIKKQYGALLMVDEAHSLGTIGDRGKGVGAYFDVDRSDVDMWMGTMSKSLASCGGYISGSKELVELLKYSSDGFMYSVGISPSNAAAALAAINELDSNPELVSKLQENSAFFLSLMKEAGIDTGLSAGTPIVPCILGDSARCMQVSGKLFERGINVMPIIYPAVPESEARLRFFLSVDHTQEEMIYTVDTLKQILATL